MTTDYEAWREYVATGNTAQLLLHSRPGTIEHPAAMRAVFGEKPDGFKEMTHTFLQEDK